MYPKATISRSSSFNKKKDVSLGVSVYSIAEKDSTGKIIYEEFMSDVTFHQVLFSVFLKIQILFLDFLFFFI